MPRYTFDGTLLRAAREAADKPREAVALEAGVSHSLIAMAESGHKIPSAEKLATIAAVIGVPLDALFQAVEEVPA